MKICKHEDTEYITQDEYGYSVDGEKVVTQPKRVLKVCRNCRETQEIE